MYIQSIDILLIFVYIYTIQYQRTASYTDKIQFKKISNIQCEYTVLSFMHALYCTCK